MKRHFPHGLLIFPVTMVASAVVGVLLTGKILCALETLVLTNVLDEMGDRLSEVEKADLEGRIRERIFE